MVRTKWYGQIGIRTKCYWTKWYGHNGTGKMVAIFGIVYNSNEFNTYIVPKINQSINQSKFI